MLTFSGTMLGVATLATAVAPHAKSPVVPVAAHALAPKAVASPERRATAAAAAPAPLPASVPAAPPPPPPLAYNTDAPPAAGLPLSSMAGGILVDLDRRQVLWSYQWGSPRPTASLGKIFTVMVAMDHASLGQWLTVPPGGEDDNPTDSVMGLHVGDRVTVKQLVEGIWLASGDDAAETLARSFIPRDQFIAEMNAKAAMLGLQATHLSNPSGLDDPGQYVRPNG